MVVAKVVSLVSTIVNSVRTFYFQVSKKKKSKEPAPPPTPPPPPPVEEEEEEEEEEEGSGEEEEGRCQKPRLQLLLLLHVKSFWRHWDRRPRMTIDGAGFCTNNNWNVVYVHHVM